MELQTQPLVCKSHTTQFIGLLIIGIIIGLGISSVYTKKDTQNQYQAGYDNAKAKYEESIIASMPPQPTETHTISGSVTKIEGNRITLHTESINPFENSDFADRVAIVASDTKIIAYVTKTQKTIQAEMDIYLKKANTNEGRGLLPPEPFIQREAPLSEIVVGVNISATSKENIKTLKEFIASEIQFNK